jgi:hypothetical protein
MEKIKYYEAYILFDHIFSFSEYLFCAAKKNGLLTRANTWYGSKDG